MFSVFFFFFKRFCLTLKVVHVHESISYVILLFASFPCFGLCIYVCICVFRLHNKGEYPITKIFVLVKGIKECNILFFLECQFLLI